MAKAWVEITCENCGNTFVHTAIKMNRADADNYEEWAKSHITICPECFRKAQEEEKKKKVFEIEEKLSLPALEGSEKQVAWATDIRYNRVRAIKRTCNDARDRFRRNAPERVGEADKVEHKLLTWICSKTTAKFYIDTRNEEENEFYNNHKDEWNA